MAHRRKMEKPDIFQHHDYREYLKVRAEFEKATNGKSLRMIAAEAKIAPGFLPMVFSGKRGVSPEILEKIGSALSLTKDEQKHLRELRTIAESASQTLKLEAMEEIQRHRIYRDKNPKELEVHQYLTHWFNVAIREMVNLEDFVFDARWIRNRLRVKVPLQEISNAMAFLEGKGFIEKRPNGKVSVSKKKLECIGSVYSLALSQFHREMLKLAGDALDSVPQHERSVIGLTFPIPAERFGEIFKLLDETLDKIDAISAQAKSSDSVYHVGISLFPLTHNVSKKQRGKS